MRAIAAEIWRYDDFQNGCRPPCWIYCDVIILYKKTDFNALDIVLNFNIHRFHTFWYTSTIMFYHFSLKLPIFALIFSYFEKYGKVLKFKCCNPQKAHLCVRPRALNSRCLTYFYPSVHETKKIVSLCAWKNKQEAQLMLTNPHDAFRGQSRSSNLVSFHT